MARPVVVGGLVCVVVLAAWLAFPARIQAGAATPVEEEKAKLADLLTLQAAMASGEHALMHEILDTLLAKYPNDLDIKRLDQFHESWHSRAKLQEETAERANALMKALTSGGD